QSLVWRRLCGRRVLIALAVVVLTGSLLLRAAVLACTAVGHADANLRLRSERFSSAATSNYTSGFRPRICCPAARRGSALINCIARLRSRIKPHGLSSIAFVKRCEN